MRLSDLQFNEGAQYKAHASRSERETMRIFKIRESQKRRRGLPCIEALDARRMLSLSNGVFTYTGTGSGETITLGRRTDNGITIVYAKLNGTIAESYEYHLVSSVSVLAGSGNDIVNFDNPPGYVGVAVTLNGEGGNDTIT